MLFDLGAHNCLFSKKCAMRKTVCVPICKKLIRGHLRLLCAVLCSDNIFVGEKLLLADQGGGGFRYTFPKAKLAPSVLGLTAIRP